MKSTEEILEAIRHLPSPERQQLFQTLRKEWLQGEAGPAASGMAVAPDGRDWLMWASGRHKEIWRDAQGRLIDAQEYVDQEQKRLGHEET